METRTIPSSGEPIPVIGLGTWQTFDTGPRERESLATVADVFAAEGGRVIDTSPMYGRAEERVGEVRENAPEAFIATKVWTRGRDAGIAQMETSARLLGAIDLMQIHNLVDWRTHLATLRMWKERGRIRYIGITHYQTSAFADLEAIMRAEPIDFVQLPLSIALPDAEDRLLPLAQERGIAVVVNRPFEGGSPLRDVRRRALPQWAADFDCRSWSEVFLRWIVSHPAVTCVIPATANIDHLRENMRAGNGRLLDAGERTRLRELVIGSR
jgi:diketogulonate reductase-like aldo/keto reductase